MLNIRRESLCRIYSFILAMECVRNFEDTKGVIRIRKSKNRQHDGQQKKDKQRYTKYTHKTEDRVTRTPPKTGVCAGDPER